MPGSHALRGNPISGFGGMPMLITDLAMRDMDQESRALLGWIPGFARLLRRPFAPLPSEGHSLQTGHDQIAVALPGPPSTCPITSTGRYHGKMVMPEHDDRSAFRWRRHPQLRNLTAADSIGPDAQSAAARGVFFARRGRLEQARLAFAAAARDETVDLTNTAGFWSLSRGAMLVASDAYADVERFRDASALAAHIRTTYRPRTLRPLPVRPRRDVTASGD